MEMQVESTESDSIVIDYSDTLADLILPDHSLSLPPLSYNNTDHNNSNNDDAETIMIDDVVVVLEQENIIPILSNHETTTTIEPTPTFVISSLPLPESEPIICDTPEEPVVVRIPSPPLFQTTGLTSSPSLPVSSRSHADLIKILEVNGVTLELGQTSAKGEKEEEEGREEEERAGRKEDEDQDVEAALDRYIEASGTTSEWTTITAAQKGKARAVDQSTCSYCLNTSNTRPRLANALLNGVQPSTTCDLSTVPCVMLTFNNVVFDLFHSSTASTSTLIFTEANERALFYEDTASFMIALRQQFSELSTAAEELVLSFPDIGISIAEDNVYARQVSLFDFNRIHLGCDLPGELNITLECQSRFVSDFNALATHVQSQSMEGTSNIETTAIVPELAAEGTDTVEDIALEDEAVGQAETSEFDFEETVENESYIEVENEDEVPTEAVEGEEYPTELIEDGEWLVEKILAEEEDDAADLEQEVLNLEAALAEMDNDDLVALVNETIDDLEETTSVAPLTTTTTGGEGEYEVQVIENTAESEEAVVVASSDETSLQVADDAVSAALEEPRVEEEVIVDYTLTVEDDATIADTIEENVDVVIDYEEVFASTLPSPNLTPVSNDVLAPIDSIDLIPAVILSTLDHASAKRSLDSLEVVESEVEIADGGSPTSAAKRARLEVPTLV